MKAWQFFLLCSNVFAAPHLGAWCGALLGAVCLCAAVWFAHKE